MIETNFLSAWAWIKRPQELKFMTARLILTIIFVGIMGWLIERIIGWTIKKNVV